MQYVMRVYVRTYVRICACVCVCDWLINSAVVHVWMTQMRMWRLTTFYEHNYALVNGKYMHPTIPDDNR